MSGADINNVNSLAKTIVETINQLANEAKNIKYKDETKKMRVVSVPKDGICKVSYNGKEFSAKTNCELKIGQTVWVLAPSGDYTNLLIVYK